MHEYWIQNAERLGSFPPILGSQNTGRKAFTLQSRDWKLSCGESDQRKRNKNRKDSDYWEFCNKWPTQFTWLVKSTATSPIYIHTQSFQWAPEIIFNHKQTVRELSESCEENSEREESTTKKTKQKTEIARTVKGEGKPHANTSCKNPTRGFSGESVVKNLPSNAGDMGSVPDLGRSHMPGVTKLCDTTPQPVR